MNEISKPRKRIYWVLYENNSLHTGYTDPGQVTSSGQRNLISSENLNSLLDKTIGLVNRKELVEAIGGKITLVNSESNQIKVVTELKI